MSEELSNRLRSLVTAVERVAERLERGFQVTHPPDDALDALNVERMEMDRERMRKAESYDQWQRSNSVTPRMYMTACILNGLLASGKLQGDGEAAAKAAIETADLILAKLAQKDGV